MPRRAARVDANQSDMVSQLRQIGVSVTLLHAVGGGVPDLLCGYQGRNVLIEAKDGSKPPSARKLTPDQVKWHEAWRGQVAVAKDIREALKALGIQFRGQIT